MREIYKDLMAGMKDGGPAFDLAAEMVSVINQMLETKTRTLVSQTDRKIFFWGLIRIVLENGTSFDKIRFLIHLR